MENYDKYMQKNRNKKGKSIRGLAKKSRHFQKHFLTTKVLDFKWSNNVVYNESPT